MSHLDYEPALVKQYEAYLNKCKKNDATPNKTLDDFKKINNMKEVINCSFMAAGHGFVLKALLQGDLEVSDGRVIDKGGILE